MIFFVIRTRLSTVVNWFLEMLFSFLIISSKSVYTLIVNIIYMHDVNLNFVVMSFTQTWTNIDFFFYFWSRESFFEHIRSHMSCVKSTRIPYKNSRFLKWYGKPTDINVDKSTIKSKYFQPYRILKFNNIWPNKCFVDFFKR